MALNTAIAFLVLGLGLVIHHVGQDMAERKRAVKALKKAHDELEMRVAERTARLEAANKELEAFSYSVSHDLRAPLRSIDGFSQALFEDYTERLDGQGREYLQRVRAACRRMGELIDDLLKISRVTRSEMQHSSVDLSEMAKAIAEKLRQRNPERVVAFVIPAHRPSPRREGMGGGGDGKGRNLLLYAAAILKDGGGRTRGERQLVHRSSQKGGITR